MNIIKFVLIAIEMVSSLLLIGIILIQKSKGGGLGESFGGSAGESLFGARAGNVLTKGTIILSSIFMANTIFLAILFSGAQERSLMERELGTLTPQPIAPQQPSPQTQAAPPPVAPPLTPAAPVAPVGREPMPGGGASAGFTAG